MRHSIVLTILAATLVLSAASTRRWGEHGHTIAARAAVAALPDEMPAFFRDAAEQLVYLNPEPDRWRGGNARGADRAMDAAGAPEHFIDLELLPAARRDGILRAPDRFAFADSLRRIGEQAQTVGVLPFTMLEYSQRVRTGFQAWRRARSAEQRAFIEARIINDAGILGHYVTDASNPAHTTIHFNGWSGRNPKGYATDNRFHSRFESAFVQAHVRQNDLTPLIAREPRTFPDLRSAILAHITESNALVERLYELDKAQPFSVDDRRPEAKAFAATRLAAGAQMLRDLWWSAWVASAAP
jgi:hypothetical protein